MLTAEGKPVRGTDSRVGNSSELTVPTPDPAFYLGIDGLNNNTPGGNTAGNDSRVKVSIHTAGDGARLLSLRHCDEMGGTRPNESSIEDDFTVEKRFHFVPSANLLVTIPFTNDRLVLRSVDVGKALDNLGSDFFFVTTPARLYAQAGKPFEHQIDGRSKAGGLRYALAQGPDGVTVDPAGKLTWPAPKSSDDDSSSVVVTVTDAKGNEHFHTVSITVLPK